MTQIGLHVAMNDHYFSEFYAEMFAVVLCLWFIIAVCQIIYSYRAYSKPIQRSTWIVSQMKNIFALGMNNFDQYKDLQLLNFTYHSLVMTIIYSFTIVSSVYYSIDSNNVLIPLLRNRIYKEGKKT